LSIAACGAILLSSGAMAGVTFETLDNPADLTYNQLLGINNSGLIAGFYGSGQAGHPNQGYLLTPPHSYTAVNDPSTVQTQLTELNNFGISVGYDYPTNGGPSVDNQFGFYFHGGTFTPVNNPKTPHCPTGCMSGVIIENQLLGVNDHNIAVGFYNDGSGNSHGYTYDIATGTYSPDIKASATASSTVAAAINNSGEIAGFFTDATGTHGFLDNGGMFNTVNAPGASQTDLLGLNNRGLAVGFDIVNGVTHGIVFNINSYTFATLTDPNATGGVTNFNGINDLNQIVGFYVDAAGNNHGLLVTGIPEPSTWAMLVAGFTGLGWLIFRRSRKRELASFPA
jgi:hypothetical protein